MVTLAEIYDNPFNAESAQHTPIGTGAIYARPPDEVINHWRSTTTLNGINGNKFGQPLTRASTALGHPTRTLTITQINPRTVSMPIPNNFPWYESGGEAGNLLTDNFIFNNYYRLEGPGSGNRTAHILHQSVDARTTGHAPPGAAAPWTTGTSAAGMNTVVGQVRGEELLATGVPIRHVHCVAVPRGHRVAFNPAVLGLGIQWPAGKTDMSANQTAFDGDTLQNTGPFKYGSLLAFRPGDLAGIHNNIDSMSISAQAKEIMKRLATSHCHYGVRLIDGGDGFVYRGSPPLGNASLFSDLLAVLRSTFWLASFWHVTNDVIGATATRLRSGGYSGQIGTPTLGSDGTPVAGGGTPLAINSAYDAGSTPTPPPTEAAMPTLLNVAAFGLEEAPELELRAYPVSGDPGVDPGTPRSGYQAHYEWYHALGARSYPSCVLTNALSTGPTNFSTFLPFSIDINMTWGRGHHGSVWWHIGSNTDSEPAGLPNKEIDLCEYVIDGANLPAGPLISNGTHGDDSAGAYVSTAVVSAANRFETWNTHSIAEEGTDIVWRTNGTETHRQAAAPWLTLPVMLIIGFEIGGTWPGLPVDDTPKGQPADPTTATPWPARMRIRNLVIAGVNVGFNGQYGQVYEAQGEGAVAWTGQTLTQYWNSAYPFGYNLAGTSFGDRRLYGNDGKEAAAGNVWLGNTFDGSPGTTSIVDALVLDGWTDPFLHRVTREIAEAPVVDVPSDPKYVPLVITGTPVLPGDD